MIKNKLVHTTIVVRTWCKAKLFMTATLKGRVRSQKREEGKYYFFTSARLANHSVKAVDGRDFRSFSTNLTSTSDKAYCCLEKQVKHLFLFTALLC